MEIQADQFLRDLGLSLGMSMPLLFNDQRCARLLVGTALAIDFEHLPGDNKIQMSCNVSDLPAQGRESLYLRLLEANLFGVETEGATLAVDSVYGQVVLGKALLLEQLTARSAVQQLESFVNSAEYWVQKMAELKSQTGAVLGGNNVADVHAIAVVDQLGLQMGSGVFHQQGMMRV